MSGVYIPGRLAETDPILWEALCVCEALVRFGYVGEAVSGTVRDPKSTMYPDQTKPNDVCLCIRVRAEVYDKEIRVTGTDDVGKILEKGVGHTRTVELMIAVGPLRCTPEEFPSRWLEAMGALRAAPESEVLPLWKASRSGSAQGMRIIERLLRGKGFEIRR